MRFADPLFLLFLLLPLGYAALAWLRRRWPPPEHLGFPALAFLGDAPPSRRARWRPLLPALRLTGTGLLIVALARPVH